MSETTTVNPEEALKMLKARAYDTISNIEFLQGQLESLNKQIAQVIRKMKEEEANIPPPNAEAVPCAEPIVETKK